MEKNKSKIINLGCRLNIYEGEVIKSLTNKHNVKDYTIINSCAVTNEAEKKVRYEIRKAKRLNPSKKIVVTGCAAQINPEKYSQMPEVYLVLGNHEKMEEKTWENIKQKKRSCLAVCAATKMQFDIFTSSISTFLRKSLREKTKHHAVMSDKKQKIIQKLIFRFL